MKGQHAFKASLVPSLCVCGRPRSDSAHGFENLEEGRRRRDEALDHVNNPPWRSFAERALEEVAKRQPTVTSDDVWAELDREGIPRPSEGRAMGPVMMAAVKSGVLQPEGYTSGTNPKHHADVMRVYRSMLWVPWS